MTHLTGPRAHVVRALDKRIREAIIKSGATTSEAFEAMHEVGMDFVHRLLKPFEGDCPTCPKPRKR